MKARPACTLSLLILLLALAGCGNKGDLVLPDEPESAPTEAPPTQ